MHKKTPKQVRSPGADDENRDFQPVAITGSQPVEKISTHKFASFSSNRRKSDVYNPVSVRYYTRVEVLSHCNVSSVLCEIILSCYI